MATMKKKLDTGKSKEMTLGQAERLWESSPNDKKNDKKTGEGTPADKREDKANAERVQKTVNRMLGNH